MGRFIAIFALNALAGALLALAIIVAVGLATGVVVAQEPKGIDDIVKDACPDPIWEAQIPECVRVLARVATLFDLLYTLNDSDARLTQLECHALDTGATLSLRVVPEC